MMNNENIALMLLPGEAKEFLPTIVKYQVEKWVEERREAPLNLSLPALSRTRQAILHSGGSGITNGIIDSDLFDIVIHQYMESSQSNKPVFKDDLEGAVYWALSESIRASIQAEGYDKHFTDDDVKKMREDHEYEEELLDDIVSSYFSWDMTFTNMDRLIVAIQEVEGLMSYDTDSETGVMVDVVAPVQSGVMDLGDFDWEERIF